MRRHAMPVANVHSANTQSPPRAGAEALDHPTVFLQDDKPREQS